MDQIRWVDVDPERFAGWVTRFGDRHGGCPTVGAEDGCLILDAPDGERAECHPPPGAGPPGSSAVDQLQAFTRAAAESRRIGLLLARRGGFAVGVADGPRLVAHKVDTRYVQSRTAAGGWSQQRFARRRENQAKALADEAAGVCARILVPGVADLAAVVTGGDRTVVEAVLSDTRLGTVRALVTSRFLTVPDPRLAVLEEAVRQARCVRVRLIPAQG